MRQVVELSDDLGVADHRWQGDGSTSHSRHRHGPRDSSRPRSSTPSSSDLYVRSSFRLVVHPSLPSKYLTSGSIPREAVLRAVSPQSECPICISPATVPRMLACGHLMCLVCFIGFRQYSEDKLCPLCGQYVPEETTPVSLLEMPDEFLPKPGHEAVLRLMSRSDGNQAVPSGDSLNPERPKPEDLLYCRVVYGSQKYLRDEIKSERLTLEHARTESLELYDDDNNYDEALASLKKLASEKWPPPPLTVFPQVQPNPQKGSYYFYETCFESSTFYVLSQLDVSVLRAAFGEYTNLPDVLIAPVENVTFSSFDGNPELFKRYKYLSHIPSRSLIGFLECDWRGILPDQALKKYSKQLAQRRRNKFSKDAREERDRVRAEHEHETLVLSSVLQEAVPQPSIRIDPATLPTLPSGKASLEKPPSKKAVWDKNQADRIEGEHMLNTARQNQRYKKGRWGKQLIISSNE